MKIRHMVSAVAVTAVLSGCTTFTKDPNDPRDTTKRGAAIGAIAGAVAGAVLGDKEADKILIGAALGAGLGAGIGAYMDKQRRALEEIEEVSVEQIDEETLQVHFDSDILFDVDSAVLDVNSRYSLNEFADVMNDFAKTAIVIQGHTDSTGSEEYNQSLSERRSRSVFNHLVAQEVSPDRMIALGYGEGYPVADNASEAGRTQNRRVTILVKGKT